MKKLIILFVALIMIFTFVACTPKAPANDDSNIVGENPADGPGDNNEPEGNDNEPVDPTPNTDSQEVTLYFANKAYVETGDESLEKLISETREIEFGDISLEEAVVRELIKGPENTELYTEIPTSAKLLGVELTDGTAFVNFAQEGLNGGSLQETFTINQIVSSLVDLEGVDRVQFLIDVIKVDFFLVEFVLC